MSNRIRWDRLTPLNIRERYSDMISAHLTVLNMKLANSNVSPESIDAGFDLLIRLIHSAASTLPHSRFIKHIKPFWNDSLNELKQAKVLSYRLWVATCRHCTFY